MGGRSLTSHLPTSSRHPASAHPPAARPPLLGRNRTYPTAPTQPHLPNRTYPLAPTQPTSLPTYLGLLLNGLIIHVNELIEDPRQERHEPQLGEETAEVVRGDGLLF